MTREEANRELFNEMINRSKNVVIPMSDTLIDKIYDDFESRTCENCEWERCGVCTNDESLLCADFIVNDFGCNKFIIKDNR